MWGALETANACTKYHADPVVADIYQAGLIINVKKGKFESPDQLPNICSFIHPEITGGTVELFFKETHWFVIVIKFFL